MMTTTPLIASRAFAATPTAYIDVVIAWMTAAPTIAANRENRPPAPRAVPPMTTARMASSSRFRPMLFASDVWMFELATRPAMPAHIPQNMYANSFTRFSFTPLKKLDRALIPTDSMNMPSDVLRVSSHATTNTIATMYSETGRMTQPLPRNAKGS